MAGLSLTRLILTDGTAVVAAARHFGADTERETRSICWLFRRSLDCLTKALGLSSSARAAPRVIPEPEDNPAQDPARHADAGDLADLRVRSGRGRANDYGRVEVNSRGHDGTRQKIFS